MDYFVLLGKILNFLLGERKKNLNDTKEAESRRKYKLEEVEEILRVKRCCKPKNMSIIIIYFETFFFAVLKKQHPVTANTHPLSILPTHLPLFSKTSGVQ